MVTNNGIPKGQRQGLRSTVKAIFKSSPRNIHEAALNGDISAVQKILDLHPQALHRANDQGMTSLALAILQGNLPLAKHLHTAGASPHPSANNGLSLLCLAVTSRNPALVHWLAHTFPSPSFINARDPAAGHTALHLAVCADDATLHTIAPVLLAAGADPNLQAIPSSLPLPLSPPLTLPRPAAAASGQPPHGNGDDDDNHPRNVKGLGLGTPLFYALDARNTKLSPAERRAAVEMLLRAGADPRLGQEAEGTTCLHEAVAGGDVGVVEVFLDWRGPGRGMGRVVEDRKGEGVKSEKRVDEGTDGGEDGHCEGWSRDDERGEDSSVGGDGEGDGSDDDDETVVGETEEETTVTEPKLDINAGTTTPFDEAMRGTTPLMLAAAVGSLEMVRFLLARGADPRRTNALSETALHWAAVNGSVGEREAGKVIRLLVREVPPGQTEGEGGMEDGRMGLHVNTRNRLGGTALHDAAYRGRLANARALLELGADMSLLAEDIHHEMMRGVKGTAEDLARGEGHREVAETIRGWESSRERQARGSFLDMADAA